jgi:hypothetical protein
MKRNILGLAAIVLAIGFSAFTQKKTASVFYGLKQDQVTYQKISGTVNEGLCHDVADFDCVIGYDADQGSTLNANSLPSEPTFRSQSEAIYFNN